jgi:tricorn protease
VQGFTPDGKAVLFTSQRAVFTTRYSQLFTVPVGGGMPEALPIPNAARATYSPDGPAHRLQPDRAAVPAVEAVPRRHGVAAVALHREGARHREDPAARRARERRTDPMWIGDTVYFRSDRNGEFNLFAYDTKSRQVRQVTRHTDFPVLTASAGGGRIIYEQAGVLHVLDPRPGKSPPANRRGHPTCGRRAPAYARGTRWIREAALSPTGARAVFGFRGEIVTVPGEKGDVRNLTNSVSAHDRDPAWSPGRPVDRVVLGRGRRVPLCTSPRRTARASRARQGDGAGFYRDPVWSPDSQKIAYFDNSLSVYWVDVKSGVSKKIASQPIYGP